MEYLAVAAIVFALNLLPAFGPPTSAVLVALTLSFDLSSALLVAVGAVSAASGRLALATMTRRLRPRLSPERRRHLKAAEEALLERPGRSAAALGLFALSPIPSGQLFVAAGLMRVSLVPLTAAFFAGRVVSYTIYVTGASAVKETFGDEILDSLVSPLGIALQVAALALLVVFLRLDWADILSRRRRS